MSPDGLPDPIAIAIDVGARLDALGVNWVIGGSIASSVHGEPRATQDVDLMADLVTRQVRPLVKALERDYYVDGEVVRDAVRSAGSFNVVHFVGAIKVDVFVAGDDPFEAQRLAQRQRVELPSGTLHVDTAENCLLRKLEWYRRGGEKSERQWRDVQAIARIQGERVDRAHLDGWAERLGVADLLERVLSPPVA